DVSVENSQDCERIAIRLAQLAEIDAQEYYRPLGYDTMFRYCVGELHFSEDSAWKRIQAAKICRRFPVLFEAVADGRLHLSAVCMLAPRLEPGNVDELLAAATHRSKSQIEQLLAERFPKPDVPTHIRALPQPAPTLDIHPAPGQEIELATGMIPAHAALASAPAPGQKLPPTRRAKVAPLAAERYALHVTIPRKTREKLRRIQDLLSHSIPSRDVAEALDRAFDALLEKLEKRKFAATQRPRVCRGSANPRYVPADVRRAVNARDGGQCTFVSDSGRRCDARRFLEYDHVLEVARGGRATVEGIRLRCRAHNQYSAEQTFGVQFMRRRRREAADARAAAG